MRMPFGKFKGIEIEDLSNQYLDYMIGWMEDTDFHKGDLRKAMEEEHAKRVKAHEYDNPNDWEDDEVLC